MGPNNIVFALILSARPSYLTPARRDVFTHDDLKILAAERTAGKTFSVFGAI